MCFELRLRALTALTVFAGLVSANADTITVDGKTHENVIVRQSESRYYIQNPSDGSVFSVDKSAVASKDVCLTSNLAERASLQTQWELKKRGESETVIPELIAPPERPMKSAKPSSERPGPIRISADSKGKRTLSKGAHYAQGPAPSPMRGHMGNPDALQTRVYALGSSGDTMPKIIVQNSGGPGGGARGGIGGSGGGSQFSSISQLFSTIDDTMVGETPAPLGNQILVSR
ncbi:MAG: hypothetical protein WC655_24880 [Candidatus Hydrogenedentales bacterium]|jgi:hypothetical protein